MRKPLFLLAFALFFSCKTEKIALTPLEPARIIVHPTVHVAQIQIADAHHLSYEGLPALVYFEDGSTASYTTDAEGKVSIVLKESPVTQIIYDFTNYKRIGGRLLAKADFEDVSVVRASQKKMQPRRFQPVIPPVFRGQRCLIIVTNR